MFSLKAISNFFGSSDRKNARKYGRLADQARAKSEGFQSQALGIADERRTAEQRLLNEESSRFDNIYAPMENSIADQLNAGPRMDEQAEIAGSNFSNEYDASIAAREREEQRMGVNHRAGSSASRMRGENDAYNRARGMADTQNIARREEDDRHFLRKSQFFNANGSGIRGRLMQGMNQMYGADYSSTVNAANHAIGQSEHSQGVSNQYSQNSGAGINTLLNIGGRVATGMLNKPAAPAGVATNAGGGVSTLPK